MNQFPKTIKGLQEGLMAKEFSAVELVNWYLARVKRLNQKLNVFVTISDELAYKQAKKLDELIRDSSAILKDYPLLGVVVAYKDLFLTKGVRTTAGSKILEAYVPPYSASVVEKLEKAGTMMLGKLNCDAWAHGASGENSDFGPTKNPWNESFVPGGSSSGSAVAVAADMSVLTLGTDTGGSVRQPASLCGVVGLKPTYGALSRYGVIAMASSVDTVGHFTHSVEDSEKVFHVLKGEDGKDSTVKNYEPRKSTKKIKIGIPKEYFIEGLDNEVEKSVLAAANFFKQSGVELIDISLPHTQYAISTYYIIQPAEVSSNLARYDGIRYGNDRSFFGKEAMRRIMLGTYVLSAGYYDAFYLKAMKVRSRVREDFEKAFTKVDAILAPVSPTPAFKLGEKSEDPLSMYLADIFTVSANLSGIPSLAIPSGFSSRGLPLGFQLMGPRFSENLLFQLGKLYQKNTDWHLKEPKLV